MNVYRFLNSRDIRDYLIETKYEFAPDEALFVILTSRNSTVGEKQTALSELADAFPDFIIEKRRSDIKKRTLAHFAKDYIEVQNAVIKQFFDNDGGIYFSDFLFDSGFYGFSDSHVFGTFNDAFNDCCDDSFPKNDYSYVIKIKKVYVSGKRSITLFFRQDKSVVNVEYENAQDANDEKEALIGYPEWMWVSVPTPFKRGDILYNTCYAANESNKPFETDRILVLDYLPSWDERTLKKNGFTSDAQRINGIDFNFLKKKQRRWRCYGDTSDMLAVGCTVSTIGEIRYDSIATYLDFEHFRGESTDSLGIYTILSGFYKGRIDECSLLNDYYYSRSKMSSLPDECFSYLLYKNNSGSNSIVGNPPRNFDAKLKTKIKDFAITQKEIDIASVQKQFHLTFADAYDVIQDLVAEDFIMPAKIYKVKKQDDSISRNGEITEWN